MEKSIAAIFRFLMTKIEKAMILADIAILREM
jgi:hypothetical protein